MQNQTLLSVNVNKIATLRNSRGKDIPNLLETTLKIIEYGAQGITVHPRPDERHIRKSDVYELSKAISVEFNIEGYPSEDYLQLIEAVRPAQATLVPDPPDALTSNAGWQLDTHLQLLKTVTKRIQATGAKCSLFMDPKDSNENTISQLKLIGCDRIELYTEAFADDYSTPKRDNTTQSYYQLAEAAHKNGIHINAGHDLNLDNLNYLVKSIPFLAEVSIGHALMTDALEWGLKETLKKYLACLKQV